MRETNQNTTRSESDHEIIKRFKEIISKDSESIIEDNLNQENTPFYKNKIFIFGSLIITVAISRYYFDEIKTGYGSIIDWINSFRPTPPDSPTGNNSNNSTTPTRSNIQERLNKYFKDPEAEIKPEAVNNIELVDNTQHVAGSSSIDKGKGVLTSPSLENLNNKAQESWSESSSDSSSSTITQEKVNESSSSVNNSSRCTPFVTENWKLLITNKLEDFNFIENTFSSEDDLTKETAHKLVESLANIMVLYDDHITSFERVIKFKTEAQINAYYQTMYHFREWISIYHSKILPLSENKIAIGNMFDEPTSIN